MSGFNTKERNNNGEFEITFYTENQQDFKKVQDLCRELIGHGTPISNEGDLISRSELKKEFDATPYNDYDDLLRTERLIDNAPTVEAYTEEDMCNATSNGYDIARRLYERPQGEWIKSKDGYMRCNQCGSRGSAIKARFCHHCGADMRGEKND